MSTSEGEGIDLTGDQEWTEPEAESHVSSVLRQLNEIVDEAELDSTSPQDDVGLGVDCSLLAYRILFEGVPTASWQCLLQLSFLGHASQLLASCLQLLHTAMEVIDLTPHLPITDLLQICQGLS